MDLLRFSTAGSVDDGKSTLIGRLLYDSKGIFEDQLAAIERTSRRRGYNKMDLVGYSEEVFQRIQEDFKSWAQKLDVHDIQFIPLSALHGDNVVTRSLAMTWYQGPSLLYHLEHVYIGSDRNLIDARFPVQWVIRPQTDEHHDYRGYAGQVAAGVFKKGDTVVALPSGRKSRIRS